MQSVPWGSAWVCDDRPGHSHQLHQLTAPGECCSVQHCQECLRKKVSRKLVVCRIGIFPVRSHFEECAISGKDIRNFRLLSCRTRSRKIRLYVRSNLSNKYWRSCYCIAGNFRLRKIRQKRPSGSLSGIYFRQMSVVACLLAGCSAVAFLLTVYFHIHECFWSHTFGFVKKFSQKFNLVKKLLWRKRRN